MVAILSVQIDISLCALEGMKIISCYIIRRKRKEIDTFQNRKKTVFLPCIVCVEKKREGNRAEKKLKACFKI